MEDHELARIIAEAIKEALQEKHLNPCVNCSYIKDPELHQKHHEFVDGAIRYLAKLEEIKWFSFKTIAATLLMAVIGGLLFIFFGVRLTNFYGGE